MTDTTFAQQSTIDYIVERTGGEIVRDSLRIYREHFASLVTIYAIPLLPVVALSIYAVAIGSSETAAMATLLQSIVSVFPTGAVTVAVSDVCLGNRPSVRTSYRIMFANLWRYLGTYLLLMLAFFFGLALLVIPGLIVAVWFMFACQVCVIERRGPVQSLRRSRRLVRGSFWRCVGVWLALVLILLLAIISVMLLVILFNTYALGGWYSPDTWTVLDEFLGWIITLVSVPFVLTGLVLLYYDLRVRKENFDSASLMDELMH